MFNLLKRMLKTGVVTTKEPFKAPPANYRGTILVTSELCTHCQTCVQVCPAGAISYKVAEDQSFARLEFDYAKCMYCGLCVEKCVAEALTQTNLPKRPVYRKEGLVESFYLKKKEAENAVQ